MHPLPFSSALGSAPRLQIFVSDLNATGVVRNAIVIANQASASGYDARLLTCRSGGVLLDQVDPGVTIVELGGASDHGNRHARQRRALLAYRRHIRDWQPHIMLSAGNHGHLLSCLAWAGAPGTKMVRISNDPGHGAARSSRLTRARRNLKLRLIGALSDKLVLVSPALAAHPYLDSRLRIGRAIFIPNGVDVELVRRNAAEPAPHLWLSDRSIPTILAVGRHSKQKNFPTLLRAFAAARQARPLRLMFLGDGDPAARDELRRMAVELDVADSVSFVSATPNPFPYMARASMVALPSLWEGSSNVLLEAMACGTPVVASITAGDASHLLDHGRFGILFEPRNEEALAGAILRQAGPNPVMPGDRAMQFHRGSTLNSYLALFRSAMPARSGHAVVPQPASLPPQVIAKVG